MSEFELPQCLAVAARAEGREEWLRSIPDTLAMVCNRWRLTVGRPFQPGGHTAWVAPARDADGEERVLKVGWRHLEAEHEADGLRLWSGTGAVRLYDATELDDTLVLLMERAVPGHALADEPEDRQDEVIAGLLPRLWRKAPDDSRFRPLAEMCDQWADHFERKTSAGQMSIDSALAAEGIALFRSLPRSAERAVVLCTDLHAGNVLAGQREAWLVVDPKPYVGDPCYDVLQHLLNCPQRLHQDAVGLVTKFAAMLGLDRVRLRLWLLARCVQESPDWPELWKIAAELARV